MRPAYSFDAPAAVVPIPVEAAITPEWAWGGADGAGVRVAIIDSGVDASHPKVGNVAGAVAFEPDPDDPAQVRITEGPHDDLFGHGTACAGIIRAVAPAAELYSVRVLGRTLRGKGHVFAAGLEWAIDAGFDVINLSLSTRNRDHFARLHELVDRAYFRNLMLVSAINNVPAPSYPSEYSSVFSVAAHGGTDPFEITYNSTPPVEFGAPGIELEVAWLDGKTIRSTGNSYAAPHIAGLIARVLSKHPGLSPFQMKTILHALASNRAAS
jgi:subtilisin family serine protease